MSEPHTLIIHHGYLTEQDSAAPLFALALSAPHHDRIDSFFSLCFLEKKWLEVRRWVSSSLSYFPNINKYFQAHFVFKLRQKTKELVIFS